MSRPALALIVFFTLTGPPAGAQRPSPDTVRLASLPDTAQVLQLNAQAWSLRRDSASAAILVGNRSLELARRIGFRAGEAQVLNYIGVAYQWLGEHKVASRYYFEALHVAEAAGVVREQGYALNNISSLLLIDHEEEQALTYAERALALQLRTGDRSAIAYAQSRLSEVHRALGRYDDAVLHARAAYQLWIGLGDSATAETALRNEALAYEGKGRFQEAYDQLRRVASSPTTPALTRLHIYSDLARLSLRLQRPDQAIALAQEKIQGGDEDAEIMRYLAEAYATKHDWPRAYAAAARGAVIQDSVGRLARTQQLRDLQQVYEASQQEAENDALRQQLRLSRFLAAAIGAAFLMLGYIGVSMVRQRREQEAASRQLATQLVRIQASEAALAEGSRQQRAILDNVPDAMWVKDTEGYYTAINVAFAQFFDRPMETIVGHTAAALFPKDDDVQSLIDQEIEAILTRKPSRAERAFVFNGRERMVETTVSPVLDTEGRLLGTTGIARDISARKASEAALRESERRFRAIFDQTFQFIGLLDLDGRVIEGNRTALEFAGVSADTVRGRYFWDTPWWSHSPEQQERVKDGIRRAARGELVRFEATHPDPAGRVHHVDFSLKPVRDDAGAVILLIPEGRDITERKEAEEATRRLQERMTQAQKLESLGVLAGGIAHDFNNLLAGILGNAELARAELAPGDVVAAQLAAIERAALRGAELSRNMLAFTGRTQLARRPVDIAAAARLAIAALDPALLDRTRMQVELPEELPRIQGDPEQVAQLLEILLTNAVEALGDSAGTVVVRLRHLTPADAEVRTAVARDGLTAGDHLLLEVTDSGPGMSAETRQKIFEPFFTTKFTGRGLGLAAAQGIVRAHNGIIRVRSELGHGCTFEVFFPVASDWQAAPKERGTGRPPARLTPPGQKGADVILVVDDEEDIRNVLRRVLERSGFSVLTAADGIEAIEAVRARPEGIALVVLDLLMPRLDGTGAMRAIRRMVPGMPIVIASGYGGDAAADDALQGDHVAYLRKPYPITDLLEAIRTLLPRAEAGPRH